MFARPLASVNGIYMVYLAFYVPVTLLVHHPISARFGTRGVLAAGTLLSILSLWLRLGITGSGPFAATFFSNLFGALSFPLFVNEIPRMVPLWFPAVEVPLIVRLPFDSTSRLQRSAYWECRWEPRWDTRCPLRTCRRSILSRTKRKPTIGVSSSTVLASSGPFS